MKTKTKGTTLFSFRRYNRNPQQNLSKEELATLQLATLTKNKEIIILVLTSNPLTKNKYIVKDSFHFAQEICEQVPALSMGSSDVYLLFTSIHIDEFIDICVNQLFENTDIVGGFTKSELKQLLCLATKEFYVIFNGLLYRLTDGKDNRDN